MLSRSHPAVLRFRGRGCCTEEYGSSERFGDSRPVAFVAVGLRGESRLTEGKRRREGVDDDDDDRRSSFSLKGHARAFLPRQVVTNLLIKIKNT